MINKDVFNSNPAMNNSSCGFTDGLIMFIKSAVKEAVAEAIKKMKDGTSKMWYTSKDVSEMTGMGKSVIKLNFNNVLSIKDKKL